MNQFEKTLIELDEIQFRHLARIKKWEDSYRLLSKEYCEETLHALLGCKYYYPEQPEKVAALRRILWQDH